MLKYPGQYKGRFKKGIPDREEVDVEGIVKKLNEKVEEKKNDKNKKPRQRAPKDKNT